MMKKVTPGKRIVDAGSTPVTLDNVVPGVDISGAVDYAAGTRGRHEPHIGGCCCYQCLGMDQYLMHLIGRVRRADERARVWHEEVRSRSG